MINFLTFTGVIIEYSNCFVERTCHKLSSSGSKINVCNWTNMILVDNFGFVHFPDVEGVGVSVVTASCDVNGLDWIEG